MSGAPGILVVRRDNIGDLVCTTPLVRALRRRFPDAWIGALVNSYNAPVLQGNPDLNEVFSYRKLKHRGPGEPLLANLRARWRIVAALRRKSLDYVLLAGNAARSMTFARMLRARQIVTPQDPANRPDDALHACSGGHEAEITFGLARAFGIAGPPPPPVVYPDADAVARLQYALSERLRGAKTLIGIHISARKPSQRWPMERFAGLMRELARREGVGMLLFWSPGPGNDPVHPGDDEAARALCSALQGLPLAPVPTHGLGELIAGLSLCDRVLCSDGGAMHLAAALGKPIVCLFGRSDPVRWHPYGVRYELLQPPSMEVRDVAIAETLAALARLG